MAPPPAHPARAPARRPGRGFTILELLVALSVISVLAAYSIATYFSRSEVTLESAAVLLAEELRTAQNRSLFLGEPSTVVFFPDGYRVLDPEGRTLQNPRTLLSFERRYSRDGVFRGVTVLEASFGAGNVLELDGDGLPRQGGTILLGFGDERRTIVVTAKDRELEILGSSSGWVDTGL